MSLIRVPLMALAACLSVPALVSPAAAQSVTQHPVTLKNFLNEAVEISWSRNGSPTKPLGTLSATSEGKINVTPGDVIHLSLASNGREIGRFQPTGPQTVTIGEPQPAPGPGPQPNPGPGPQPNPAPVPQGFDREKEKTAAINYLNAVRQNPLAYRQELGFDTSVIPVGAPLKVDARLTAAAQRKAEFLVRNGAQGDPHYQIIDGKKIGMNRWMREAGYKIPGWLADDDTNFECFAMAGHSNGIPAGQGIESMKGLLRSPGHRIVITGGHDFWKPCTDVGVGIALTPDGKTMYMIVLVGHEGN